MLAPERHEYILNTLKSKKTVQVSHLTHALHVSSETVRRDLEYLEKEGLLRRVHGGAALVKLDTTQDFFDSRVTKNSSLKNEIAQKALAYVSEGYSLALDCSTTSLAFARLLRENFHALTIVTNSTEIINALVGMKSYRIIQCGGTFNHDERACFGTQALELVHSLNLDVAFLGVGGISIQEGLTENYFEGAAMLQAFLQAAQQKIVLADHTKFDTATFVKVCDLNDVDCIITDSELKPKTFERYRSLGVEIIS